MDINDACDSDFYVLTVLLTLTAVVWAWEVHRVSIV